MADHARDGQPLARNPRLVVVPCPKRRIAKDGGAPDLVEGDRLGSQSPRGGDGNARGDTVRVVPGQGERLHAAHRAAHDREEPLDAQEVQERHLDVDHVFDGHHRETTSP